jgi:lactoylglutathione lyase
MITARHLFEAHVVVADLDVSVAFYRDALGLELAHTSGGRQAAFFWVGPRGGSMLGLWAGGIAPQRTPSHIAFAASVEDVLAAPRTLRAAGITPLDFDGQPSDEPVVLGWMPAVSVYFRDPDGHLLEYLAMLPEAPQPERGVVPWRSWSVDRVPQYTITRARPQDLAHVPQIELAAARLLQGYAPEPVLGETTSEDELRQALRDGHLWVALADEAPVGFAHVVPMEPRTIHLEELDVLPRHGRRGLGRRLVEEVCRWATSAGYDAVTLTTFRDLPWNGPFYERLGFRVLSSAEISPALRRVIEDEARRGLDPARRVAMRWRPGRL